MKVYPGASTPSINTLGLSYIPTTVYSYSSESLITSSLFLKYSLSWNRYSSSLNLLPIFKVMISPNDKDTDP